MPPTFDEQMRQALANSMAEGARTGPASTLVTEAKFTQVRAQQVTVLFILVLLRTHL